MQGTLDLLVLKVIALQPMHGWAIAQRIRQMSGDHGGPPLPEAPDAARPWCPNESSDFWQRPCRHTGRIFPDALHATLEDAAVKALGKGDWVLGVVRRLNKVSNDEVEAGVSIIADRVVPITVNAKRAAQEDIWKDLRSLAYFGICDCQYLSNQYDSAIVACQKSLSYYHQDPFAHFDLGLAFMHRYAATKNPADLDPALQHLKQVVAINPDLDQAKTAQKNIANIEKFLGQ